MSRRGVHEYLSEEFVANDLGLRTFDSDEPHNFSLRGTNMAPEHHRRSNLTTSEIGDLPPPANQYEILDLTSVYLSLWKKDAELKSCDVSIPISVIFQHQWPMFALQNDQGSQNLLLKRGNKVEPCMLLKSFTTPKKIVWVIVDRKKKHPETSMLTENSPPEKVEWIVDRTTLENFLTRENPKKNGCVLMDFAVPYGMRNHHIRVMWSPIFQKFEKWVSTSVFDIKNPATFIMNEANCKRFTGNCIPPMLKKNVLKICSNISDHFYRVNNLRVNKMDLVFKINNRKEIVLLWISRVKIKQNNYRKTLNEHFQTRSNLQRSFKCELCSLKFCSKDKYMIRLKSQMRRGRVCKKCFLKLTKVERRLSKFSRKKKQSKKKTMAQKRRGAPLFHRKKTINFVRKKAVFGESKILERRRKRKNSSVYRFVDKNPKPDAKCKETNVKKNECSRRSTPFSNRCVLIRRIGKHHIDFSVDFKRTKKGTKKKRNVKAMKRSVKKRVRKVRKKLKKKKIVVDYQSSVVNRVEMKNLDNYSSLPKLKKFEDNECLTGWI